MTLHVFLKNKVISADAIVPVLMQARAQGNHRPIVFYLQSAAASEALKRNSALWEGIKKLGKLEVVVARRRDAIGRLLHWTWGAYWLLRLSGEIILGRARIIHFGQLYNSLIYRSILSIRSDKTLLFEASFAGHSRNEHMVDSLKPDRKKPLDLSIARNVIVFSESSQLAQDVRNRGRQPIVAGKPHLLAAWQDHLASFSSVDSFEDRRPRIGFILGTFGVLDFLKARDSVLELFKESIALLLQSCPDHDILLKPHAITDMETLRAVVSSFGRKNISVTQDHPFILGRMCDFCIANYYSTAFSSVVDAGGISVEYTEYSDATLRITGKNSIRPDIVSHFIQREPARLLALAKILSGLAARRETPSRTELRNDLTEALMS